MELTLLGTGSPVPPTERGGTGLVVSVRDVPLLVDCGPLSVYRMVEYGFEPGSIEHFFFTHHHVDHNADFFQFVLASWSLGRESLTLYGPEGTDDFLAALHDLYAEDIAYRKWFAYPDEGIDDVEVVVTDADFSMETDRWSVAALPVEHSIETYAYRFEEHSTGDSCVVSGDTRRLESLVEFARGADVLVQDCCIGPVADEPPDPEDIYR